MNKVELIKNRKGFITTEILIASVILITTVSGVLIINFGNQTSLNDESAKGVAKTMAYETLENSKILASKDFQLISSTSSAETVDGTTYLKVIDVETLNDFLTKKINISISWVNENNRPLKTNLATFLSDANNATTPNFCDSNISGNWKIPKIINAEPNFSTIVADPTGTYPITKIKVFNEKMFVTVNNQSANTKETFFIFDITDPKSPALLHKIDNSSVSAGLNDIAISGDYAFVASGYGANFTNCIEGQNCAQLQIIDLKNTPKVVENFKVPNVTGLGGQGVGESVVYNDGYVYLGLAKVLGGSEFNIIDVRDFPNSKPIWVGGVGTGGAINSILIKNNYAFLATADSEEMKVIDISDKSNPTEVGYFNSSMGAGNGKSMYLIGDNLYLGKTFPNSGNDFHVIDVSQKNISLPEIGGMDIGSSVNKIIVRDFLAYTLKTNGQLEIINISNKKNPQDWTAPFTITSPSKGITMDCLGNYLFIGSNNLDKDGLLFVVTSS